MSSCRHDWSPGLAAAAALWLAARNTPLADLGLDQLAPSLLLLGLFVAGVLAALIDPGRGIQDRLAGTSLVAR